MKYRATMLASAILAIQVCLAGNSNLSILTLSDRLAEIKCYTDSCTYEVLPASMSDPVRYYVGLESTASPSDTLSPCDYIIQWSLATPSGTAEGFSVYADGDHYRFKDKRLQEYHAEWDMESFAPAGNVRIGVQQQAQFCDLLPQYLSARLKMMASDSSYIYEIKTTKADGTDVIIVEGIRRYAGYDALEYSYIFDAATSRPVGMEIETNPGQISEQNIIVKYHSPGKKADSSHIDTSTLMSRFGDAFGKYRESTFSLETLPGLPLPDISAPIVGGGRYVHARGDTFQTPAIIIFLDAAVDTTPEVIAATRTAIADIPVQVDIIWAFLDHREEDIRAIIPEPQQGETLLFHASAAAGSCGSSVTPVLIFVDTDGIVRDFINGYNQDLRPVVIQKASLLGGRT